MSDEASQNMTRPEVPQWCRDAAAEIESIWEATMRPSIAGVIAKHAPKDPADVLAEEQSEAIGLYEATTPNNYACDPTHGSYLPEASWVERFTVKELWYGNDDNKLVVTSADHDRIVGQKDAEIAYLRDYLCGGCEDSKRRGCVMELSEQTERAKKYKECLVDEWLKKIDIATHMYSVCGRVTRPEKDGFAGECNFYTCANCGAFVACTKGLVEAAREFADKRKLTHEVWCKECHKEFFGEVTLIG